MAGTIGPTTHAGAHSPHDDISDIALSPSFHEDQTVLVVSRGRLQRSIDGGERWQDLVVGFGRAPLARIAQSAADPERIYVTSRGDGVYRSSDGGATWSSSKSGLRDLLLQEVATSPSQPEVVLAAGALGGLHRSGDGGQSWSSIEGFGRVTAMTFLDDGTDRVLAGDADGRLSVSDDAGATWEHSPLVDGGGAVSALASVPAEGSTATATVVAATADGHVLRSMDSGTTFETLTEDVPGGEPRGIAISPEDHDHLWLSSADEGAHRSTDGGRSWEAQPDGLTKSEQADDVGAPHFRTIRAAEGVDGPVLFLAGFDGLFRSDDEGRRWDPVETAADHVAGLAVSPDFTRDRTVVVITYVKGGFISDDAGETWRTMNEGLRFDGLSEGNRLLPLRRGHNVVFSPDFARDRTIFSATWPQLIKSDDGGATWEEVQIEQPTEDWSPLRQYVLAVSPAYGTDHTIFAGNRHGQIFRSEGAGDAGTWTETATVDGRVRTFAISPAFPDDGVVFVSSVGGVFKSADRGTTWQATGPGRSPLATGGELDPAPLLAMSPEFPTDGTLFAGTHEGLFVTRDAGGTWTQVVAGPVAATADVTAISVSPDFAEDEMVLVSIAGDGLYRSTDAGATFEPVGTELTAANRIITDYDNPTATPIQFSRTFASDQTVFAYAGPDVVRSTDGGVTWDVLTLPSIQEVADSLGVAVDALNHGDNASADDRPTGRRTFDTPVGVLSMRRLAAAAAAGVVAGLLLVLLGVGRAWRWEARWAARFATALVFFVVAAAVMAA